MNAWRSCLAVLLSALVPAASAAPARAVERAVPSIATELPAAGVSVKLPALPVAPSVFGQGVPGLSSILPSVAVSEPAAAAAVPVAAIAERGPIVSGHSPLPGTGPARIESKPSAGESAYERLQGATGEDKSPDLSGALVFDGSAKRGGVAAPAGRLPSPPKEGIKAAALAVLAPAAVLGVSHAAALGRIFSTINYDIANGSSLIFPLPDIHRAFSRVHAIPLWRASLGAVGAALVGLMNATVLVKPFWGTMHVFIGLGLLTPYFISRYLKKRGVAFAYVGPRQGSAPARLLARLKSDKALHYTLATGALLLAASAGLYFSALAVVPHLLAATFSEATVEAILFAVQVLKAVLFAIVFAPDALDMLRGKKPHGFSLWLDLLFILSTSAFVAWGVQAAMASPPGMIRRQYLVHAIRNLVEAVAASISVISLRRAARLDRDHK